MSDPYGDHPKNIFRPGALWLDTDGHHINAHGGGLLYHQGWWYWYGEHKTSGPEGDAALVGVGVYRSQDLYLWENFGWCWGLLPWHWRSGFFPPEIDAGYSYHDLAFPEPGMSMCLPRRPDVHS